MCELFAMSARFATNVSVSLDELARHGGGTGPHRDGWGIAFLQERDVLLIREPDAANDSACLAFLRGQKIASATVVAHVRKATQGARLLRNAQPFTRELGGVAHVFAHNGMLAGIENDPRFQVRRFRPIGETDSEHAFCALLERLAPLWDKGTPDLDARLRVVAGFAADLRPQGPANFIYTDGDAVFAHGHRRRNDAGAIAPPGLHFLCRNCHAGEGVSNVDGVEIGHGDEQRAALLASVPLSSDRWEPLREGEMLVLREGRVVRREAGLGSDERMESLRSSGPG